MFSTSIEFALRAAIEAHDGQVRKGRTPAPYIVHPLHVALMLARWTQDESVILAGLMHDVVEDCEAWTLERLAEDFGAHVTGIVAELTEDKSTSWEERKRAGIAKVPHLSPQAATVKACDVIHNLATLLAELRAHPRQAQEIWSVFKGGRERTLELSGELVEALCQRVEPKVARALRNAQQALLDHESAARG
ncbi:MAG TPA: HD domain-containing protein [Planctomycetota bacterium]|nr:HD domain-containing protein [Planctomycetota bacterium]